MVSFFATRLDDTDGIDPIQAGAQAVMLLDDQTQRVPEIAGDPNALQSIMISCMMSESPQQ